MEENKVDTLTRTSKSGLWVLRGNEPTFVETTTVKKFDEILRTWVVVDSKVTDKSPSDFGWKKELSHFIILKREIPSLESFEGRQVLFYLQKISYRIRDDKTYHYLKLENGKIFLRDFHNLSCGEAPKNSNQYIVVEKGQTKRISVKQIRELIEKGVISQIFSKVINEPSGQIYGIAV